MHGGGQLKSSRALLWLRCSILHAFIWTHGLYVIMDFWCQSYRGQSTHTHIHTAEISDTPVSLLIACMFCEVFCLQLWWGLFSQYQSGANGSVGGSLHFSAFFSLFQMVLFKCSLEWPPQHKISTCKLGEDSYICSLFNYFNHSAPSNIQQPQRSPCCENWSVVIWASIYTTARCIWLGSCL